MLNFACGVLLTCALHKIEAYIRCRLSSPGNGCQSLGRGLQRVRDKAEDDYILAQVIMRRKYVSFERMARSIDCFRPQGCEEMGILYIMDGPKGMRVVYEDEETPCDT